MNINNLMRTIHIKYFLWMICLCQSCVTGTNEAKVVIDQAVKMHGGDAFEGSRFSFDVSGKHYTILNKKGNPELHRMWNNSGVETIESLQRNKVYRSIKGDTVLLDDKEQEQLEYDLREILNYALLPYGLNDRSVDKHLDGQIQINGEDYFQIQVSFSEDYHFIANCDHYIFWINAEKKTLDYIAHKCDQNGIKFSVAIHRRKIGEILFADYQIYRPKDANTPLEHLPHLYELGQIVSDDEILLDNVEVNPINSALVDSI